MSPAKTAEAIEVPFGFRTQVGPKIHVLAGGPDSPWEGAILRGKANHCIRHSAVICAKNTEPIEVLFGCWARMGPRIMC